MSATSQLVICVFCGHGVARYVYITHAGTLGAPVDSIQAWKHPYVQICGNRMVTYGCRAGLGIPVRSVVHGLTGVRWGPRVHARAIFTKPSWVCDIWPVWDRKTTNWPSIGTKSLVAHVWKLYMLYLQPRDIRHNSKFRNIVPTRYTFTMWFPTCLHRLGPYGARRLSESFMWTRHKITNA